MNYEHTQTVSALNLCLAWCETVVGWLLLYYACYKGEPLICNMEFPSGKNVSLNTKAAEKVCCLWKIVNIDEEKLRGREEKEAWWTRHRNGVGVPSWYSGLRIQHCHCSSLSHCCGMGSISSPRTLACCRYGQKIKVFKLKKMKRWILFRKKKKQKERKKISPRDECLLVFFELLP